MKVHLNILHPCGGDFRYPKRNKQKDIALSRAKDEFKGNGEDVVEVM